MEVTVEQTGTLKRKLSVEVPLSEVQSTYNEVYGRLRRNLNVPGFRPGHFPRALAEKRFKDVMASEALQTLVPKYYEEALKQKDLRPATDPKFDNLDIDQKKPLRFDVEFEEIPRFEVIPLSEYTLEEKPVKVAKKDVDARVEEMRKSRATPQEKAGAAVEDDSVTFDFEGKIDGEVFEGGSGEGMTMQLGAGQFLADFETNITGMSAGEEKSFDLTFPDDYGQASLQGKTATFTVKVTKVEERVPAEMDEAFFSGFGEEIKDENAFRDMVKKRLTEEKEAEAQRELQNTLAEQMREKYAFDVPESLVHDFLHEFEHQLEHNEPDVLKDEKELEKRKAEERKKIESDLRFRYVVGEVALEEKIQLSEEDLRQRFAMQAYMMGQDPRRLAETPFGERMVRQIQENMLTGQVLDLLVNRKLGKDAAPAAETESQSAGDDAGSAE